MTRFLACLLLIAGLAAPMAWAAQATVRSGDHGDFTRLVIHLPRPGEWVLEERPGAAVLRIPEGVTGFDLSEVFTRIDRSRIRDVVPGALPSEIVVEFACDCAVRVEDQGGGMLVLDVFGEPKISEVLGHQGRESNATPEPDVTATDLPLFLPHPTAPPGVPDRLDANVQQNAEIGEAVKAAEQRLLEHLGRAAARGVLQPAQRLPTRDPALQPAEPASAAKPVDSSIPLGVLTGTDAAIDAHMRVNGEGLNDTTCLDDVAFAIAGWGAEDFNTGLANWRSQLYGEFDRLRPEAALGLARHYLHYGFGAEARGSLALHEVSQPVLTILSHIVDGGTVAEAGPLTGQAVCDGAVALWAVLALPDGMDRQDVDDKAVVRHFAALPDHLRQRLGPMLARRLMALGYRDAAETVLRRLDLAREEQDADSKMASADISARSGAVDRAQDRRKEVVAKNTTQSPEALAELIVAEIAAGRPITPETADLAAAFAFEHRKSDAADRLAWAESLARAGAGQFGDAFAVLEALPDDNGVARPETIYDLLHDRASDEVFLTQIFPRLETAASLSARTANRLAARLGTLGFHQQAVLVLRGGATGSAGRERRLLRAGNALARGQSRQAEAEILGLSGRDVDALRAQARDMAGNHAVAARIYAALEVQDKAAHAAFLAEDWGTLANAEDPVLAGIARLKTGARDPETGPEGVLTRNRTLLDQSAAMRAMLDRLLSSYPVEGVLQDGQE
ncbi:hypothetical protein SAMN05216196_102176 [Lutimaribacter pacificus]|uniref:HEAT repeat domain-containing protein n=1 Tax=Lutimaribacter pacificus TaxID=391948 RepID=A0A1H0EE13_9RHOB|nr:hypothetical protein SAMN05216196_102176 [Lutimaribacter pacificus]SHK53961.1 hypothetical protein SAMN05444142_106112 [Lutimaribacter pacificus]